MTEDDRIRMTAEAHRIAKRRIVKFNGGKGAILSQCIVGNAKNSIVPRKIMIQNEQQLLEHLVAKDRKQAERHVYKHTDCGAWIEFNDNGIRLGSIVEGADFGTAVYPLVYPFSEDDYQQRIDAIEKEADAIWIWANEADDEYGTPAEQGIDAPDVSFEYSHFDQDGISS